MFKLRKSITLKTNALNQTIKACISQSDNKKRLHFIAFYSKKLTNDELNYEIYNQKLLTIVNSFKQ